MKLLSIHTDLFSCMQKCKAFISIIAIQPIKVCTLVTYRVSAMREYTNATECRVWNNYKEKGRVWHNYKEKGATCDLKVVMLVAVRAT